MAQKARLGTVMQMLLEKITNSDPGGSDAYACVTSPYLNEIDHFVLHSV